MKKSTGLSSDLQNVSRKFSKDPTKVSIRIMVRTNEQEESVLEKYKLKMYIYTHSHQC